VVVDPQRLFTDPASPAFVPAWASCLPAIAALAAGFTARGLPVLAVRHAHPEGDDGGTMGMFWDRLQRPGDPLSAVEPAAASLPRGTRVVTKRLLSALSVPAVRRAARAEGTIVIAGVQTHLCVAATAIEAARFALRPVVVTDATAARDASLHDAALAVLGSGHAHLATSADVLAALERGAAR
jgi:nicotinamidase-related amidase